MGHWWDRVGGHGLRRVALALPLLACMSGFAAAPAAAASHAYAVEYKGDYSWTQDYEGRATAGDFLRTKETFSWVWKISTEVPDNGQPTTHATLVAQGTIDQTSQNSKTNEHCTIHQVPGGGARGFNVEAGFMPGTTSASLSIPSNVGGDVSVTGDNNNCNAFAGSDALFCTLSSCGGATVCGVVPPVVRTRAFGDATAPFVQSSRGGTEPFDVGGGRAMEKVACTFGGTEATAVSISSTVTVGAAGPVKHKPQPGHTPEIVRQKIFAKGDLLTTMFRLEAACGQVVAGTAAGVWGTVVGVGSTAAIASSAIILTGSGPSCKSLIDRATDDAEIINDPPAADVYAVARPARTPTPAAKLPSCTSQPLAVRPYCSLLRAGELAYIAAVQHATSVDNALLQTVNRESGAKRAHRPAALALQERVGAGLLSQLVSASRAERAAGTKIVTLLRSQQVLGRLTVAQDARAIATATADLARRHVRRSKLPARALVPRAVDLVAIFVA